MQSHKRAAAAVAVTGAFCVSGALELCTLFVVSFADGFDAVAGTVPVSNDNMQVWMTRTADC